jgi:hypothetical protein
MHRPKYNESKSKIDEKDWNLGARHVTLFQYKQAGKAKSIHHDGCYQRQAAFLTLRQ